MASSPSNEFRGQSRPQTGGSQYNALDFAILQALSRVRTATLVKVVAVHGGGVAAVGTVDVQPMVNQIDGEGRSVAHGTIYGLPYFRLQYGSTAVIIDPVPGDIGMAAFADRDISAVKSTKKKANPGSFRQHDMADGLYIGSFLGGAPNQYIRLHDGGIDLVSPVTVTVTAPTIKLN